MSPLFPLLIGGVAALLLGSNSLGATDANKAKNDGKPPPPPKDTGKDTPPTTTGDEVIIIDDFGIPSAAPPATKATKGKPSNPLFQWKYVVKAGDNPSLIAKKFVGDDRRYPELILANPGKATVGNPSNPYSTNYNFKSLNANERLLLPKTWNAWVDEQGYPKGTPTPWGQKDL